MPQRRKRPLSVEPPSQKSSDAFVTGTESRLSMPVPVDTPLFTDLQSRHILHQDVLDAISQDLHFTHMMPVQAATVHDLLQNRNDCLVQARTGTGKTLAFLLPAIQSALDAHRAGDGTISTLILTPTRELALQIAAEAKSLTRRLPSFSIATSIGGTNKDAESRKLASTILVATPGRLLDHLSEPRIQNLLNRLQTLVLDEADRMLDMGFLPSIRSILDKLPSTQGSPRHSMLFSATLGDQIDKVALTILKHGYKFISTIPQGEAQTHDRVPQFSTVVPTIVDVTPALLAAITHEAISTKKFKAIVFATTAYVAELYGHVLSHSPNLPATSILHSRLSQSKRTTITNQFRTSQNAICVATDVIARGMDFPEVTHVFQVGLPMDRESYIHRLGRTARAEADGRGIIILSQPESYFLHRLKDMTIQQFPDLDLDPFQAAVAKAVETLEGKHKIYQAWLGYYKGSIKQLRWTPADLVRQANIFALEGLGCPEVPGLEKTIVGKMGLKGVPGLVIVANRPRHNQQSRRGRQAENDSPGAAAVAAKRQSRTTGALRQSRQRRNARDAPTV